MKSKCEYLWLIQISDQLLTSLLLVYVSASRSWTNLKCLRLFPFHCDGHGWMMISVIVLSWSSSLNSMCTPHRTYCLIWKYRSCSGCFRYSTVWCIFVYHQVKRYIQSIDFNRASARLTIGLGEYQAVSANRMISWTFSLAPTHPLSLPSGIVFGRGENDILSQSRKGTGEGIEA